MRAVRCARDIVRGTRDTGLSVRIGVPTGELERIGEDVGGITVHVSARLRGLASGDEVLVSSTTHDLVEGSGLVLADAGRHALKGVSGERRVYRLVDSQAGDEASAEHA